jgi:nucleoid-associated protein YgaU
MARRQRSGEVLPPAPRRVPALLSLSLWLGSLLVGIVLFHALGEGPLAAPPLELEGFRAWAADRDGLVASVALLRLLVLSLAWYLVGVTSIGILARLVRSARLMALADAITLPAIRRLLQATLGVSLAASMAVGPLPGHGSGRAGVERVTLAAADGADEPPEGPDGPAIIRLVPAGDRMSELRLAPADPAPGPQVATGASGAPSTAPAHRPAPADGSSADPGAASEPRDTDGGGRGDSRGRPSPTHEAHPLEPNGQQVPPGRSDATGRSEVPADAGVRVHLVRAGESLWTIARDGLAERRAEAPSEAQVAAYWQRVIEHNRSVLADPDNPDLIFPGQHVELPAVDPSLEREARP